MFGTVFNTVSMNHIMTVLKRAVVIIAGKNGVYVRLPGASEDVGVEVYNDQNVQKSWLRNDKFFITTR